MDWFQRWPKDALVAVSNHFLANYDIVCSADVKRAVIQTMGEFQVRYSSIAIVIDGGLSTCQRLLTLRLSTFHS